MVGIVKLGMINERKFFEVVKVFKEIVFGWGGVGYLLCGML